MWTQGWLRFLRTWLRDEKRSRCHREKVRLRARAWIKRAGHRPAAQEGGRQDREPFVPTSRGAGGVARSPTRTSGADAGPPRLQTRCAQQDSRPSCGRAVRTLPAGRPGWLRGQQPAGEGPPACLLHADKWPLDLTSSGGFPGTSRVTWAFLGVAEARTPPALLNAPGFDCCPRPPSPPDSGRWEMSAALPRPAPARCSPVPFIRALGDRHTQNGRSQHHVVAEV